MAKSPPPLNEQNPPVATITRNDPSPMSSLGTDRTPRRFSSRRCHQKNINQSGNPPRASVASSVQSDNHDSNSPPMGDGDMLPPESPKKRRANVVGDVGIPTQKTKRVITNIDENKWEEGYDSDGARGPFYDAVEDEATNGVEEEDEEEGLIPPSMLGGATTAQRSAQVSVPPNSEKVARRTKLKAQKKKRTAQKAKKQAPVDKFEAGDEVLAFYVWQGESTKGEWMSATINELNVVGGEEVYSITYFDGEEDPNVPVRMLRNLKSKDDSSPFDKPTAVAEDDDVADSESEASASSILFAEVLAEDADNTVEVLATAEVLAEDAEDTAANNATVDEDWFIAKQMIDDMVVGKIGEVGLKHEISRRGLFPKGKREICNKCCTIACRGLCPLLILSERT